MAGQSWQGSAFAGLACIFLAGSLGGCASMSEEECLNADWRLMGFEDALQGRSTATIAQHRRACAAVNVTPDLDLYRQGHEEGARQYCTPANGYRAGSSGSTYQGICPADLETAFMRGYQDGRELYTITSEISRLKGVVTTSEAGIDKLRRDILKLEETIVSADSTPDQRRANLAEIEDLGEDITELEVTIADARRKLLELESEQETVTRDHRLLGY